MKNRVSLYKAWAFIGLMLTVGILTGAATKLDLGSQVSGILAKVNGGAGADMSSVTFPGSGTLMTTATGVAASQLPNPSASTLGGVESITSASHNWIAYIDTSGVPHQSQPSYADISGTPTPPTLNQAAPSGTINSSNTAFSLSPTPTAAADISCFQNGIMLQQGAGNDYTVSGANLTWLTAPPTGAKLLCTWF